jgi:glycosyltransferase involved in cell wall biosynthesis
MRILMLAPQPFLEPRGTPISVYQRLNGLSRLGHTVDLVTYHIGQQVQLPGVNIFRIPSVPFVTKVKIGPSWVKPILDVLITWTAVRLLTARRYDVVHTHEEAAYLYTALRPLFGVPHLYDLHSRLPQQLEAAGIRKIGLIMPALEWLERQVIMRADAVITIGADLATYVLALRPSINHALIENLPTQEVFAHVPGRASSLRAQLPLDGRRAIVYTGNFARYQGVDILLDGLARVRATHPEVLLVLVGGTPQEVSAWQAKVRAGDLLHWVYFTGAVSPADVNAYLEVADILVSPRTEGMSVPLKIYSYLEAGKPIVATDLAAHTIVLDETTAVLTEPTGWALAEGLRRVLDDAELGRRLGKRAQEVARERYGTAAYLSKLGGIYERLRRETVGQRTAGLVA